MSTEPAPESESDGEPGAESEIAIDWAYDEKTMQCIPDLRTMCSLPADADNEGVHAFRALFLPKGQTVHVPGQPGCYVVKGEYRQQLALCNVHFNDTTKRQPALL